MFSYDSNDALLNDDNDNNDDYLLALSLQVIENEDQIDSDIDRELALQLNHNKENDDNSDECEKLCIVSPQLETMDPNPNIWHLMRSFDHRFFDRNLSKHCIELSWSPRMTRTAGLCAWNPRTNYCSIRLSQPLLQLRSRKDLVETLLHEMIHALLFVTKADDNHESHGQLFHEHMYRINRESGTNITVYHSFHEEVNHYLTHVWRCDGICREKSPYYGYVKRAMNRKPSSNDYWFKFHEQTCGGNFIKISEPTITSTSAKNNKTKAQMQPMNRDIRTYFSPEEKNSNKVTPFLGIGVKLGSLKSEPIIPSTSRKTTTIELANPEELKISDIREYMNLQKTRKDLNDGIKSSKVIPFSNGTQLGLNKETSTSQYQINIKNKQLKQSIEIDAQRNAISRLNGDESILNTTNVETCDVSTFIPFSGKAYRLGSFKEFNEGVSHDGLKSNKTLSISSHKDTKKLKKNDDIVVIELD